MDVSNHRLQLWNFHVDFTNINSSSFTGPTNLPTATFDSSLNFIPQPGTNSVLDPLSDRLMMRLQYRNSSGRQTLVVNHTVDASGASHAGVRWYELQNTGSGWSIRQQGTYAPDNDHRWMGSIASDKDGNLALGYSVSSQTTFPSIRYAGRLAADPLGVLGQAETSLMVGSGSETQTGRPRWGDYSMMAVDPLDNCTFWYTQEYYANTGNINWQTRIGSFRFPSCQPLVSLVGDKDGFHPGNPADIPFRSARTVQMLQNLVAQIPGQHPSVDLDVGGFDRPVGWTHRFTLPNGALITSASVKLRLQGNSPLVSNDELLYEETSLNSPFLPFIGLQDLNGGKPPVAGTPFELNLNLGRAPVRIQCPECAAGGNLNPLVTAGPNQNGEYRNLLPLLFDGMFDLALGDDATVDWSELTITYVLPGAPAGDLTGDNFVDSNDLNIILNALNTPAYGPNDPRDLDHDGRITVSDARKLALLCGKPNCAVQ